MQPEELATFLRGRPWRQQSAELPSDVLRIPSMISDEERKMLAFATQHANGSRIVELGALFGGSAGCLAFGARQKNPSFRFDVYDFFEPAQVHIDNYLVANGFEDPGSDTLPFVERILSDFGTNIRFHKGDLLKEVWTGEQIDVLHVDAAKTAKVAAHVTEQFFTALVPGSIVIMQDYFSQRHPWCVHMMDVMSDHFEPAGSTKVNAALFVCTKTLDNVAPMAEAIRSATDRDYLTSLSKAARELSESTHRKQMARHITLVEDNPGARSIGEYPVRNLTEERVSRAAYEHGFSFDGMIS